MRSVRLFGTEQSGRLVNDYFEFEMVKAIDMKMVLVTVFPGQVGQRHAGRSKEFHWGGGSVWGRTNEWLKLHSTRAP